MAPTPADATRTILRGDRQGRRSARLARNGRALRGLPHQVARRRRPCAVRLRSSIFPMYCAFSVLPEATRAAATMARMYALFDDAGKFLAGRVMSEADSSMQVELDSGKRVKVKSANVLLKFTQPPPAQLIASARAAGRADRPRPGLGIRARQRVRLRRPGARLLQRERRRRTSGRRAVSPVRGAALLSPSRQGHVPQGSGRNREGRAARHRAQAPAGRAGRRLG